MSDETPGVDSLVQPADVERVHKEKGWRILPKREPVKAEPADPPGGPWWTGDD